MICEKCAGKVNENGKCSLCNYDNINIDIPVNVSMKPSFIRSTRLTVFMYLIIIVDVISLIGLFHGLFSNEITAHIAVSLFLIALAIFEITLCFFILKLKKRALIIYIILSVISGFIQLLSLNIIAVIFKALLLYFIFRNDWDNFE